jgi:trigger factor
LKIDITPRDDHQVKVTVEVDDESLSEAMHRAARQIAKRVKIPGFRPGKAPYAVIIRQVGESTVLEQAIEIWVDQNYPKIIEESGIKAYGSGSLESISNLNPPVLDFVVPLAAEVSLGDYHSISKPYEPREITEEDIDQFIENLRTSQAVIEPVEREVQSGDQVTVILSGLKKNIDEGQNPVLVPERSHTVVIQEERKQGDEWPFDGFSKQLIGLSINNEINLAHTFPDDYHFESLRGVEATYRVVVQEVKSRTVPELNDEFATTLGDFTTVEALRAEVHSSLEQQATTEYNETYDDTILDQLVEMSVFKYPPQMLEDEQQSVIKNFTRRLEQQGNTLDLYLKARSITMKEFEDEIRPIAEARLKHALALIELAKAENIEVTADQLESETTRTMNMLVQSMNETEARRLSDERVVNNIASNIMVEMMTSRSMERFREIASGKYVPNAPELSEATAEIPATDEIAATDEIDSPELAPVIETDTNTTVEGEL